MTEILPYIAFGFVAQLIDGALGMAYGVTATSLLMASGVPAVSASAVVHMSECFTTGASAISHQAFGNVNRILFRTLVIPGMVGAALGAYVLSSFPSEVFTPIVACYLVLMGVIIIIKAFRQFPPRTVTRHIVPLGLAGGFLDAAGGGGWGPIVASTLISRGNDVRQAIGSTNAVEFFVTLSASAVFVLNLGAPNWQMIGGIAIGGVIAAPLGAWACKHIPIRPFMILVGLLIVGLSLRTLLRY
ncbi:MAG: sulfite exporter TauE/SafE family protein [Gammaproteobacteria bacterium]|nr:sulfite exporter TauE/SafE family protein [Gammaproteobacteria bacterium]